VPAERSLTRPGFTSDEIKCRDLDAIGSRCCGAAALAKRNEMLRVWVDFHLVGNRCGGGVNGYAKFAAAMRIKAKYGK
jgi:hypothetical protein